MRLDRVHVDHRTLGIEPVRKPLAAISSPRTSSRATAAGEAPPARRGRAVDSSQRH
jgi:hypothetical protein